MTTILWAKLTSWPGARRSPFQTQVSQFKSAWFQTLDGLKYEMGRIGVHTATLEIDLPAHRFQSNGTIRGDVVPATDGIVLAFAHPRRGPVRIPSDLYRDWRDNVRAVMLALEAQRAMQRYGIGAQGESFEGFKALPAGMTPADAAALLAPFAHGIPAALLLADRAVADLAVRAARAKTHPDVNAGARELFDQVERAREVLTAHFTKGNGT